LSNTTRLKSFGVENYTVFEDSGDININSITVFAGKNNVGKSSILSAINLLGYNKNTREKGQAIYNRVLRRNPSGTVNKTIYLRGTFECEIDETIDKTIVAIENYVHQQGWEPDLNKLCNYDTVMNILKSHKFLLSLLFWAINGFPSVKTIGFQGFDFDITKDNGAFTYEGVPSPDLPHVQYLGRALGSVLKGTVVQKCIPNFTSTIFYFGSHRTLSEDEWTVLRPEKELNPDAGNLKSFLNSVFSSNTGTANKIKQTMKEAFPEINDIIVPTSSNLVLQRGDQDSTPITDIRFKFTYFKPDEVTDTISLKNVGTGIEQYLAIISAIITAKQPSLFLIDEPHAFLHPFVEKKLLKLFEQYKDHTFVISTHSPTILNSVPRESINLLVRDANSGCVTCRPYSVGETLSELGLIPSDLWFYTRLLFVEGETEVRIYQTLMRRLFPDFVLSAIKIADLHHQASALRKGKNKKAIQKVMEAVIKAANPFAGEFDLPYLVVLDRETLTDSEVGDLQNMCNGRLLLTDQHEIENYLLDFDCVFQVLVDEADKRAVQRPEKDPMLKIFEDIKKTTSKGSDVLSVLFDKYGLTYDKIDHGSLLAESIPLNNFEEFKEKLNGFIKGNGASLGSLT
jgi:predicted ATPase